MAATVESRRRDRSVACVCILYLRQGPLGCPFSARAPPGLLRYACPCAIFSPCAYCPMSSNLGRHHFLFCLQYPHGCDDGSGQLHRSTSLSQRTDGLLLYNAGYHRRRDASHLVQNMVSPSACVHTHILTSLGSGSTSAMWASSSGCRSLRRRAVSRRRCWSSSSPACSTSSSSCVPTTFSRPAS